MEYKFIDTRLNLKIGSHDFRLDAGEIAVGEAAGELMTACLEGSKDMPAKEAMDHIGKALDHLLGDGASAKILEGMSSSNEVQFRRVGLWTAYEVNKARSAMVLTAFAPEDKPAAADEAGPAPAQAH